MRAPRGADVRAAHGRHPLPDSWCRRPARGSLTGLQTAVMLSHAKLPSTVRCARAATDVGALCVTRLGDRLLSLDCTDGS
jgi:hypothetical protein